MCVTLYLSEEGDDPRCAISIHVGQIDLVTEQHQPLAQLDGGEDHNVGGTAVLRSGQRSSVATLGWWRGRSSDLPPGKVLKVTT